MGLVVKQKREEYRAEFVVGRYFDEVKTKKNFPTLNEWFRKLRLR